MSSTTNMDRLRQTLLRDPKLKSKQNILYYMRPDGSMRQNAEEICFAMTVYGSNQICDDFVRQTMYEEPLLKTVISRVMSAWMLQ